MRDLEIEIKGLYEPVDAELKRLYEGFRTAGLKRNNDEVERLAQKTIGSEFKLLGLLIGKVQGAQTSVKLETYYYVSSSTLRDNRSWVLFALWFDGNESEWKFNDCGRLDLGEVGWKEASWKLLEAHGSAGSDNESQLDLEDMILRWKALANGEPLPKWRFDESEELAVERLFPNRVTERDAQFTDEELDAVLRVLSLIAAVGGRTKEETDFLLEVARDLCVSEERMEEVLNWGQSPPFEPSSSLKTSLVIMKMRLAKKIWLEQQAFSVFVAGDLKEGADALLSDLFQKTGVDSVSGDHNEKDYFQQDVARLSDIEKNPGDLDSMWSYSPTWPFMPMSVQVLSGRGGEIVPVNQDGVLIMWMFLVGGAKRLDMRMAFRNKMWFLNLTMEGSGSGAWSFDYENQPVFADLMRALVGAEPNKRVSRVDHMAPLGSLVGGGVLTDRRPKALDQGVTSMYEFDAFTASEVQKAPNSSPQRQVLEVSRNYYMPPVAFMQFLSGIAPDHSPF